MTPVEDAQALIQQLQAIELTSDSAAQKAGHRLLLMPKLAASLEALLGYHQGYRQNTLVVSHLVRALLAETFAATNGELKWATELPPGKAPSFRRALVNLITYFKQTTH
jgi:hypothetical protein